MEEGQEKPFSIVAIVLLLMIALLDDATTILATISVAIPVIGQVTFILDKLFAAIAWAIIQSWFAFRLGTFGKSGLTVMIGGALEEASIPATTITTALAIMMANHPKEAGVVAKIGGAAGEVKTALSAAGGDEKAKAEIAAKREEMRQARAAAEIEEAPAAKEERMAGEEKQPVPIGALGEKEEPMKAVEKELVGGTPLPEPERRAAAEAEAAETIREGKKEKKPEISEERFGAEGLEEVKEFERAKKVVDIQTAHEQLADGGRKEKGDENMKEAA